MITTAQTQERLARLAANAKAGQWSPAEAIDWDRTPRLPVWIGRARARLAISQLYHGEIATSRMCRALLRDVDDYEVRACLAYQNKDEQRHADVYARYLSQLGGIAAMDSDLACALEAATKGPFRALSTMVAFHVVIEGEVLRVQDSLARLLPCPLLKQINRLIARDEARHVAFGKIYLRDALASLTVKERCEIYDWVHDLWERTTRAAVCGSRSNTFRRTASHWFKGGWRHHAAALRQIGLDAHNDLDRAA